MAGNVDTNLALGQGSSIREIEKAGRQGLGANKPSPARRRKQKKKKKRPVSKFENSKRGGLQRQGTGDKGRTGKGSKVPGSLLDVTA